MHHRFSVDSPISADQTVHLSGDELHHAVRVRRIRAGELVEVFDPAGKGWEARVENVSPDDVTLSVVRPMPSRESSLRLTLALSLIKPEKFELVLQKGTELGVSRFVPLVSERVQIRPERVQNRYDRWERIIDEAVKQSGRTVRPELRSPASFEKIVADGSPRFILDAEAERTELEGNLETAVIMIGPEGGFTATELRYALAHGCTGLRIGPRRLRAETAAITAVALIQHRWGDLGD